ncbi:Rv2578c family radical SAM protein [Actinocrinis puniceicyclus]|uniref:Rv2578c family radical SAM protein n=1 Tax=Actinocrinis puniceicyclus TaxID=977794 RepID=A0A8J7WUE7_9ACTN|nr:Rv2578c family radical SAM protein [Actinocrinis puniceicyclus]MBS2966935.1 Rv2578c family radical SAM protein [Actinocrinis puniceicyclus]
MRWSGQLVDARQEPRDGQLQLFDSTAVTRTFDTPEFRGTTFYEVKAKTVLNRVPGPSPMFSWTINPYRGCTHACVYCFARNSHTYLDLDPGHDFDSKIVVKVNAPQVLRRELTRPSWRREHVAMGTNVDCYQRAEGRYRLMPPIIEALAAAHTPLSILTKGTLILRDLPVLEQAARQVPVSVNFSIGSVDEQLWRTAEPGTPSPLRRLDAVNALHESGLGAGVLMAPILPYLTDTPSQLRTTVAAIAQAGARSITPLVLHLRPGARQWYTAWLTANHPDLVERYETLYRAGSHAPKQYQQRITTLVKQYAHEFGIGRDGDSGARRITPGTPTPASKPPAARRPAAIQPPLI